MLDSEWNLVRVRQEWWDVQSAFIQNQIWRMREPYLVLEDFVPQKSKFSYAPYY
jgi:hypothetical protein